MIARFATRASLLLAALAMAGTPHDARATETALASADSLAQPADCDAVLGQARGRFDRAWQRREVGELQAAFSEIEGCLADLSGLDLPQLNAGQYREAIELRARATGLRDALAGQLAAPAESTAAKDEVLDAPAIEGIDPQLNKEVYRWIDYFTGAGRSTFERWLRRSGRYMDMFRAILEREGLPSDLVHLVFVESGFNLHARSVSAAVGPWQFLRSTARLFGLTVNQWVDERKDPEKSTVAAARYLKHLYQIFGDWPLVLASYNAGEGTVLRAIKRQGTTDYWKLRLPRQTKEYVPQFMAVLTIVREPERYGFDGVELEAPMNFDQITLVGPVDLRAVAKLAGCEYEELKSLNPSVLRHAATGRYGTTTVRVPQGTGEEIMHKLRSGQAALPAVSISIKHRVRRGETLKRIAGQYGVSASALAKANRISKAKPLRAGMVLTIPGSLAGTRPKPVSPDFAGPLPPASVVPLRRGGPAPALVVPVRAVATADSAAALAGGNGPAPAEFEQPPRSVRVRRGETLGGIARREGVTVTQLKRWNGLRSSRIHPGQRLRLEPPASSTRVADAGPDAAALSAPETSSATSARPGTVRVRRGDTLTELARRYGTSVEALMKANGLRSARSLRAGMRLTIPEA